MLRSPSAVRSLLHLSGRLLRPPNPRLPSSPLSTRPRFLSSASPTPGGARWATYDCDRLIDSLCASASDTPVESDIWAIFDPVAGRIVIQRPPPPPSTTEEEEEVKGEGAGDLEVEDKAGVKLKGKGRWKGWASGEKGQTGRPSVAAARKSARKGKGGKGSVSYMCSNCREFHSQWWGKCRYCKAAGTFQKCRDMVLQSDGDPSEEEGRGGAGEREDEEKAGVKGNERVKGNWKRKREGQGNASGEKGQTSRPSDAAARKPAGNGGKERVSYVCSHCGEGHWRWWGYCHHCNVPGTLQRSREMVPQSLQEVN
uniref:LapB rubredoxin metal binding domain-containing protein n=1 Tax=Setaria viridis TaxID=4556 RepID=A0A4U6TSE7_SETVI|nr:uncharacterized protein LOC117865237 [Setaria viridis]XP_034605283.1 uncharacterized protein LOC117865237 [Setaria viridis]XP_034605284.1 uncharacterized protein LOC117865237 [Setaria viridis]TKW04385.1 hypothetical protein SEVIR_7G105732v2 [Setaria viridis]